MNKAQLVAALGANHIEFPDKATVADLRKLYAEHIGGKSNSDKSGEINDNSVNSEPNSESISVSDSGDTSNNNY